MWVQRSASPPPSSTFTFPTHSCFDIDWVLTADGELLATHPDDLQAAVGAEALGGSARRACVRACMRVAGHPPEPSLARDDGASFPSYRHTTMHTTRTPPPRPRPPPPPPPPPPPRPPPPTPPPRPRPPPPPSTHTHGGREAVGQHSLAAVRAAGADAERFPAAQEVFTLFGRLLDAEGLRWRPAGAAAGARGAGAGGDPPDYAT